MQAKENILNILVVEDNPADFYLIEAMLQSSALRVNTIHHASRIAEARGFLETQRIDLIFLDLSLPDSFGIDSFLQIKPLVQHIPVIMLTGDTESSIALEALKQGAQDYLIKGEFNTTLLVKCAGYSIERKKAEEKILASEKNYRQMFNKNPFPAWIYNPDTLRILEVNDAAIQSYGYKKEEFLTLTIEDVRHAENIPAVRQSVADREEAHKWQDKVWPHKKKDGTEMLMEVTFYQINYFGQAAMQAQMNDVTEKIRLEKELEEQQKQRQQQVAEAILKTQEEERKRLGAELHDNINQILATARLFITTGMKEQELVSDLIDKGQGYIVMAVEEIRKLSRTLITPVLIGGSLKQAIGGMTQDIAELKQIKIITELDVLDEMMLGDIHKITVYRIIQEQLNNILKHANASEITIASSVKGETLILEIADNGVGFDTSQQSKGVGMINMQTRAELFNGKLEVDSSPGKGCRLKVILNIKTTMSQKAA